MLGHAFDPAGSPEFHRGVPIRSQREQRIYDRAKRQGRLNSCLDPARRERVECQIGVAHTEYACGFLFGDVRRCVGGVWLAAKGESFDAGQNTALISHPDIAFTERTLKGLKMLRVDKTD